MVRHLVLRFMYSRKKAMATPEDDEISLAMALAIAEGHKSKNAKLRYLSKVSVPFWVVQTSQDSSILLSAFGNRDRSLEITENTKLSEVRRIISSEIDSVDAVPESIERIIPIFEELSKSGMKIRGLESPSILSHVSPYIIDRDPNIVPNRFDETLNSQKALDISSSYQRLRDASAKRVDTIETLKTLANEKLEGHLKVLENRISLERDQWSKRISAQEARIREQKGKISEKTSEEIFALKTKHKMDMRALTAEFSRAISEVEEFFETIIEAIREARIAVRQRGEDVEAAIAEFRKLVDHITETAPRYEDSLRNLTMTEQEVRNRFNESRKGLEDQSLGAKGTAEEEAAELEQKLVELQKERDDRLAELEALNEKVNNSIARFRRILNERLTTLQQEFLNVTTVALENESISNLAPLTWLDIDTFIAIYDNNTYLVFSPSFMPEDRISASTRHRPLDASLDDFLSQAITTGLQNNPSFKASFEKACREGNMLLEPSAIDSLRSGLAKLQARQLLVEGSKHQFESVWSKYSGQCPKCGAMAGVGVKFCPGCGATL